METILPDVLKHELNFVFCGTAAGNKSAERRAYYAGSGNLFYPTLVSCGYTSRLFRPEDFRELVNFKIGLTDLAKFVHGMDTDLKGTDYDTKSFEEKILKFQPQLVCFNGKEAARAYFKLKNTKQVPIGLQSSTIGRTKLYVAPSTSSTARKYWDENAWRQLKSFIQ